MLQLKMPSPLDEGRAPQGGIQILVVDDSRLQRKILTALLQKMGFETTQAASGEEAFEMCQRQMPDLIISDWMMGTMSGLDFCMALRALPGDHYAYFILLTSKSEKTEIATGLDAGADDFLIKPVDGTELRARITAGTRVLTMQRELSEKNRLIGSTLEEIQGLYNSIDKDLIEAKKLQQSLVKDKQVSFPEGQLNLLLRSSGHVGGDLVGFFPLGKTQLGLYSIDVSGHGISSALMTARLAGYLSATSPEQNIALFRENDGRVMARSPSESIEELNELVLEEMETEHYFTILLAVVDLLSGRVILSQAGHPHPVVQRCDGTVEQKGTGGFPVGLMSGVSFEEFELQLRPGDRLLLLSDGITECPDPNGELLGEEGLTDMLGPLRTSSGAVFFDHLQDALEGFAGTTDFPDDVSGLLFEYHGAIYAM